MNTIPVYIGEQIAGFWTVGQLAIHAHMLNIIRNRRGHPKRAYFRTVPAGIGYLGTKGKAYEQRLNSGKAWALTGTPGSDR